MKRLILQFLSAAFAFTLLISTRAAGLIIVENPDETARIVPPPHDPPLRPPIFPPPHWLPRPIHRFTPLELRAVTATGTIKDQIAATKIEQEFYNPNASRLEGTFILPLPKGAHLEKFSMEVNGKMTEAELLTAEKAKHIYEEIVRKCKDPALLEFVGRDLLKVRIFPIEPHSTKRVELSYTQLLKSDAGLIEYSLPLNTAKYCSTPIKNFSLKIELRSSTPLKAIYSPSHSVELVRGAGNTAVVGFEQSQLTTDKDFQLFYSAEETELGLNFLTYRAEGEDGYFMLLAAPGFESKRVQVLPKDVVFVLDTSGSMAGKKLAQAKKALLFCINNLNEADRFEIIRFSTEAEPLFGNLSEFSRSTRQQAETFVEELKPIGGTAINDALKEALEAVRSESGRPRIIVFLTDGRPTVGETSESAILDTVRSNTKGVTRIFAFGLGTDVNAHLLDRIAEKTKAVSQYVLPDEDLELKLSSFFSKISDPVLSDLSIDFGRIRPSKMHPGEMPDLFRGQQLIVLGRYKQEGKATVRIKGKIGDESREFHSEVKFPETDTEHKFIPRLWATRRVGYLLDEITLRGENSELKGEVTELARKYGIVTPYTSYLVTEDEPILARGMRGPHVPGRPEMETRLYRERLADRPLTELGLDPQQRLMRLQKESSGDAAVLNSRYNSALKSASSEDQLQTAPVELHNFAVTGQLQAGPALQVVSSLAGKPMMPARQFAGTRTFQNEKNVWVETTLLGSEDESDVIRVEFDSKEYWAFAAQNSHLSDVLALGTDVKFLLGNRTYVIYSKNN